MSTSAASSAGSAWLNMIKGDGPLKALKSKAAQTPGRAQAVGFAFAEVGSGGTQEQATAQAIDTAVACNCLPEAATVQTLSPATAQTEDWGKGLEHETHQQHTQQHQQQHQIQPQQQAAASSKPGGQESAGKPPQPATLAAPPEEVKMVLCVDVSLGMGKAKLGGHIARATVGLIQKYRGQNDELLRMWEESGQAKILRVKDEPEMEQLADQALQNNLPFYMAHHTGTTKTRENLETVKTVLAIGPAYKSDIDKITGHLSLL
eukprot:GHUV01006201.1.p1 GENE.GHUV01006201.1~~GHUV01006201.1.p1  ORF type:complete len:262 (+),score=95.75 GHUV01006201.1:378-1163(+)